MPKVTTTTTKFAPATTTSTTQQWWAVHVPIPNHPLLPPTWQDRQRKRFHAWECKFLASSQSKTPSYLVGVSEDWHEPRENPEYYNHDHQICSCNNQLYYPTMAGGACTYSVPPASPTHVTTSTAMEFSCMGVYVPFLWFLSLSPTTHPFSPFLPFLPIYLPSPTSSPSPTFFVPFFKILTPPKREPWILQPQRPPLLLQQRIVLPNNGRRSLHLHIRTREPNVPDYVDGVDEEGQE